MNDSQDSAADGDPFVDCAVEVTADNLGHCHRCGADPLLVVRVPHSLDMDRAPVGTRGIVLCPACDDADPDAQGVLAFFALNERITDAELDSAATLIYEWAQRKLATTPTSDEVAEQVAIEYEQWIDREF